MLMKKKSFMCYVLDCVMDIFGVINNVCLHTILVQKKSTCIIAKEKE